MSPRVVTIGLIVGSLAAAWLRFDAGAVILGWCVVLICFTGAIAAWILHARRLPPIQLPAEVQDLATREELTPLEDAQLTGTLQGSVRTEYRFSSEFTTRIPLTNTPRMCIEPMLDHQKRRTAQRAAHALTRDSRTSSGTAPSPSTTS